MAATLVVGFVVTAILTTGGVGYLAGYDLHFRKESAQQKNDNIGGGDSGDGVKGSGGGYPSSDGGYGSNPVSGLGYGSNPPKDSGDSDSAPTDGSTPIPTQPGSWSGSGSEATDHIHYIPKVPIYVSIPTDRMPHIPDVPIKGTGLGSSDFWSSSYGSWPDILSKLSTIASIFRKPASSMFPSRMTLLQALRNRNSDAYSSLLKQASASMLNAFVYRNFEFSPEDVKKMFGAALTSPNAAAMQASQFARANLGLK